MTKQLTKQTIGVGVAGTGFIGPAHIEGLRRNGIQVLGLVERTAEKAQSKAAELGIPRLYGSLKEMLADPDIDVVHLATPNHLHHSHAKAALLAGKHVICEKPLAMTSEQSAELVKLAAEKQLVNAVNFNIRMYPLAQQARSMVQSGELGDLFIPGKAVEFPDVFDLIKGKQPAQAGMFTSLDIDQAQEGIGY